jgi:hypothetical protein
MSNLYPSSLSVSNYSFRWTTPDGVATIFVIETEPLTISITIGKAGTSIAGWAYALSELTNLALTHHSIEEVINILQDITTHQSVTNIATGVECRSTPEAVGFSLSEYRRLKKKEDRREHPR